MTNNIKMAVVLIAVVFVTFAMAIESVNRNSDKDEGTALADGQRLYRANCVVCHGANGKGNTPIGRKLKVKAINRRTRNAFNVIKHGKRKMPAFRKKLTDRQIRQIVGVIRSM